MIRLKNPAPTRHDRFKFGPIWNCLLLAEHGQKDLAVQPNSEQAAQLTEETTPDSYFTKLDGIIIRAGLKYFGTKAKHPTVWASTG